MYSNSPKLHTRNTFKKYNYRDIISTREVVEKGRTNKFLKFDKGSPFPVQPSEEIYFGANNQKPLLSLRDQIVIKENKLNNKKNKIFDNNIKNKNTLYKIKSPNKMMNTLVINSAGFALSNVYMQGSFDPKLVGSFVAVDYVYMYYVKDMIDGRLTSLLSVKESDNLHMVISALSEALVVGAATKYVSGVLGSEISVKKAIINSGAAVAINAAYEKVFGMY